MAERNRGRRGRRPNHLVVFASKDAPAASVIQKITGAKPISGDAQGIMAFTAAGSNGGERAVPQLFGRLGVAALDLDSDQVERMADRPEVEAVVPNQKRYAQVIGGSRAGVSGRGARTYGGTIGTGTYGGSIGTGTYGGSIGTGTYGGSIGTGTYGLPGVGLTDVASVYSRGQADGLAAALRFGSLLPLLARGASTRGNGSHSESLDLVGVDAGYRRATGRGVRVAVLDTGIDLEHPDFAGRLVEGDPWDDPNATAVSFAAGETVDDGNGHGSHCAGIIAGAARSAGGRRYGVAPDVELLVAKVLGDDGSGYDSDILAGIAWAFERGARVISMSLGSGRGPGEPYAISYERVASELLASANGPLLVAAAGNESDRPGYVGAVGNPAACPSFLAVAAIDPWKAPAWFSCGQRDTVGLVDLAAPGVDVYSALNLPHRFGTLSGTSMACPHVAGVAALWLEREPQLTARELWSRLEHHAIPLEAGSAAVGRGLVQAP